MLAHAVLGAFCLAYGTLAFFGRLPDGVLDLERIKDLARDALLRKGILRLKNVLLRKGLLREPFLEQQCSGPMEPTVVSGASRRVNTIFC